MATNVDTAQYLAALGVGRIPPATTPFDPGYDPATVESHLAQSAHLMAGLKLSMACWLIADQAATRAKVAAAAAHGVDVVVGGGPFEIAAAQGRLPDYLDLCAGLGVARVECSEGFTDLGMPRRDVARLVLERGLQLQCELGKKHEGSFTDAVVEGLIDDGRGWLGEGATEVVVEAREAAVGIGLFDGAGRLNTTLADRFVEAFGLGAVTFEAPDKPSQFALLDHFGRHVRLGNVRLEELLRVEIYRRGLHSDAFAKPNLRPGPSAAGGGQPEGEG